MSYCSSSAAVVNILIAMPPYITPAWSSETPMGPCILLLPDGRVCGVIARRARQRGAWVAPANDVLVNVIDLTQDLAGTAQDELYQLGVNIIQPAARGYLVSGAHTLSDHEEWMALKRTETVYFATADCIARWATVCI